MGRPLVDTSTDGNVNWERSLTLTEVEEEVLVTMCKYYIENSWIDRETENAFDTLVEKVCEPAPWDYSVNE